MQRELPSSSQFCRCQEHLWHSHTQQGLANTALSTQSCMRHNTLQDIPVQTSWQ